jgi:glycerate-2-kinase
MMDDLTSGETIFGQARAIYEAALRAVSPELLVIENVAREGNLIRIAGETFDLGSFENVYLVAFGKAAAGMSEAMAEILDDRLSSGLVVLPASGQVAPASPWSRRLQFLEAGHPLPDKRSVAAARRALALASKAGEKDLVIICASGGGSSLLCLPADRVTLSEKKSVTRNLLRAGANIRELNAVRKHLSGIKGGRLAKAAFPATVVSLVISDVVGDDLEAIASGPAHWDSSSYADGRAVLEKYGLWKTSPLSIRALIEKGIRGGEPERLKRGDPVFENVHTFVIGNTLTALLGARREAERLGFEPFILTSTDEGEARKAARDYAAFIASQACSIGATPKPICLLAGGELTVTVKGRGTGGRNMEFALASLIEMGKEGLGSVFCGTCGLPAEGGGHGGRGPFEWLALSIGTDGIDGPTDAAGAWADMSTLERSRKLRLDLEKYLARNDSYSFFKKTGNLIVTGPTGTNVCDVRIFLIKSV